MISIRNIKQLIRTTTIEADPEKSDIVFDRILKGFENSSLRLSAEEQHGFLTAMIKSRPIRLAMASVLVLASLLARLPRL